MRQYGQCGKTSLSLLSDQRIRLTVGSDRIRLYYNEAQRADQSTHGSTGGYQSSVIILIITDCVRCGALLGDGGVAWRRNAHPAPGGRAGSERRRAGSERMALGAEGRRRPHPRAPGGRKSNLHGGYITAVVNQTCMIYLPQRYYTVHLHISVYSIRIQSSRVPVRHNVSPCQLIVSHGI